MVEMSNETKQYYFNIAESKRRNREIANNIVADPGNDDIDADYVLIYKDIDTIIEDLPIKDIAEKVLMRSIIDAVERRASAELKAGKNVRIPFICAIRKSKVANTLQKHYKDFKEKRKTLPHDEYRAYVKKVLHEAKEQEIEDDIKRKLLIRMRKNNRKKYDERLKLHGKAYADFG